MKRTVNFKDCSNCTPRNSVFKNIPIFSQVKAPQSQLEAEKNKVSEDKGDNVNVGDNNVGKNVLPNFLPPPLNYAAQNFKQASSVSNNAAESVNRDEQQEVLPLPVQNADAAFPLNEKCVFSIYYVSNICMFVRSPVLMVLFCVDLFNLFPGRR